MNAGKGSMFAMTRIGSSNDQSVPNQIWTIPTLFTYPSQTRSSDVYKTGVDNPAYFDSECQVGDREGAVATVVTTPAKLKKQPWLRLWKLQFIKSEKVRQRRALALMVIFIFVLIVLVIAIGLAIYLSMRDMGWSWTAQDDRSDEIEENWAVAGEFRITNRIYTTDLSNPSTAQYIRLAAEVLQSLDDMFIQSPLVRDYNTSEIVGFREGSVIVNCHIFLNRPIESIAQKIGLIFIRNLEMGHGILPAGSLHVDIQTIRFVGIHGVVPTVTPIPILDAEWSEWSEWSSCFDLGGQCDPHRIQSRSRDCRTINGRGARLLNNAPCQELGKGRELEIKDCICSSPSSTEIITTESIPPTKISTEPEIINTRQPCSECPKGEVCLLTIGSSVPYCFQIKDANDPRGCGGWCSGIHELCRPLNSTVYQCLDDSGTEPTGSRPKSGFQECLEGEWKCANGLCVPSQRRCDGHFNCYDMTDEYNCECQPEEFHCANNTSCLPKLLKCNGVLDCWDGSDELNCTVLCPDKDNQYTCNDGQCISSNRFCDRYSDCVDRSDEPEGCNANCTTNQYQCNNGRCIDRTTLCNSIDDCGDESDEHECKTNSNKLEEQRTTSYSEIGTSLHKNNNESTIT